MFYKKKYRELLEQNKELKETIKEIMENNTERQWKMLCEISKLGEENEKLEKEIRQIREISNSVRNA